MQQSAIWAILARDRRLAESPGLLFGVLVGVDMHPLLHLYDDSGAASFGSLAPSFPNENQPLTDSGTLPAVAPPTRISEEHLFQDRYLN